ncbi:MAG: electron transfer flavoprotein subunit alpha/FixB family protein [Proteobacteria bacterium]|nr:electron transfer flavoprotein subunit alpha/FixB family protein [Pseudomonadota bacterium]
MSRVLVIAEFGASLDATAKCVRCASSLPGATIDVVVFGSGIAAVAAAAARLAGVTRVLACDSEANRNALAAVLAPQVARLAAGYTHVFAPSTTFGKDLLPRVAALIDAPMLSDIMAVESATRFRRPIYAGNAILTVEVEGSPQVLGTVRIASFDAVAQDGAASVESIAPDAPSITHTRFAGIAASGGDRPDLQAARRVVSGGRALGSADKFGLIYELADTLGAAVGASRAAVDAGYAPNDLQVGQTGKIIAPELYIAVGISGAIQHMTGIKDARTIVAINKDADAPIFEAADYGLVADLFEVLPQLTAAIKSRAG